MSYITLLDNQIKTLLKFAFLFVGDIEEAKVILEKSIRKTTKKANRIVDELEGAIRLREEVLRQCHRYSKSLIYQKDSVLKSLGIKSVDSPHSASQNINKLPKAIREVAISHFILNQTSSEMVKSLNIPPGHVALYLKKANEKLGLISSDDERKFIRDLHKELAFIDELELKPLQIAQTQSTSKRQKPSYLKWSFAFSGVAIILIVSFVLGFEEAKAPTERNAPNNDIGKDLANEDNPTIDNVDQNPIINTPLEPRVLEDISIQILAYEGFYRYSHFPSAKEAKKMAAEQLYYFISTIEFANERNIYLSEGEQKSLEQQNRSRIESLKYFPDDEKFLNNLLNELQITEDQYIEYYVNLENEYYVYENKMYELNINLDELNQKLYIERAPAAFYERAGITLEEAKELEKAWHQPIKEVTERQFNLPFDLTGSMMHIIQLENGQYVFENPSYFDLHSTKYGPFLENYVFPKNPMHLNRTSLDDMIAYLENFQTDDEANKQLANELVEVYKLLKQSIDWELY